MSRTTLGAATVAEVRKLRSLRSTWAAGAVAAALSGVTGFAVVAIAAGEGRRASLPEVAQSSVQGLWFVAIVLAVLLTAGEFQHRTIRTTLLGIPSRRVVLAAKAVVTAGLGALIVVLGTVIALASGGLAAALGDGAAAGSAREWAYVAAGVPLGAVWALVAAALGALTRSTAVALTTVLLWRFVAEQVIPLAARQPELRRWTPSYAGDALAGLGGGEVLAPVAAAGLLLAYLVVLLVPAAVLFLRRDVA
jgi:ABC-2 type transport system permease protein